MSSTDQPASPRPPSRRRFRLTLPFMRPPNPKHYPRKGFIRALRSVFLAVRLLLGLYVPNAAANLYNLAHADLSRLVDRDAVIRALILPGPLANPRTSNTIYMLFAALFLLLAAGALWAWSDQRREQAAAQQQQKEEKPPEPLPPPQEMALLPRADHFVGRPAELAWVRARLQEHGDGALGITGLPGVGKTALAAEAIRPLAEEVRFAGGLAVVRCLGRREWVPLLREALSHFDPYRKEPEATDVSALAGEARRLLAGKDALLVLDNVEPELDVEALLGPLQAADVSVVLTARQVLPLPSEAQRELQLLPEVDVLSLCARAYGRESVAQLSPDEHAAAERIVHTLARHTYAVELAARYAKDAKRPLDAVAAKLQADPLNIPKGEEQRAIEKSFQLSIAALPPQVQQLFEVVAHFCIPDVGRNAIAAMGTALKLGMPSSGLDTLIRRALVDALRDTTMSDGSDRDRLRVHPLVQVLGEKRFATWTVQRRMAADRAAAQYYAGYVNRAPDAGLGPDEPKIQAVLEWAQAHKEWVLVVRLCAGMQYFWRDRGRTAEALRYLPWGLAAGRHATAWWRRPSRALRLQVAQLRLVYGQVLLSSGNVDAAERAFRASRTLWRRLGDRQGEATALNNLGELARQRGQLDMAERYFEQALPILREVQDRQGEATVLNNLGLVAYGRGQPDAAQSYFAQALDIDREVQNRRGEATVLNNLGEVARRRGQPAMAERYFAQALDIDREVQSRAVEATVLNNLGQVAYGRGQLAMAERYFEQALPILREVQNHRGGATVLNNLGEVARRRGQPDAAQTYYEQALPILREVQDRAMEATVLNNLGQVAYGRGQLDMAQTYYAQALVIDRVVQDRGAEATVLNNLGQVAYGRGQLDMAQTYYEQALPILREVQDRGAEATVLNNLGELARQRGQLDMAQTYLEQALPILREVQNRGAEAGILNKLGGVAYGRGQLDMAQGYYEQALPILREVGARRDEGVLLFHVAHIASAKHDVDRAEALHRASLAIAREIENARDTADSLQALGELLIEHRHGTQDEEGCALLADALQLYIQMGAQDKAEQTRETVQRLGCAEADA